MPRFSSSIFDEIPVEVAQLASELHCQCTQNISTKILTPVSFLPRQSGDLFNIEANELIFTSIAARNYCTAVHSFRKFDEFDLPWDIQKVFDEAQQLRAHEISFTDFASGRFLGLMSHKLNVLHAGIEIISNSDTHTVFNVLSNIGNALPFLGNVSMKDLADLAAAQHSKTSGDMLAGMFFNQLRDYLSVHPQQAKALYTCVRENMAGANTDLYGAALIGMAIAGLVREATELALDDAKTECNELIAGALWVLGRLSCHWEKETDLKNRVQEVLKVMGHHSDSNVKLQTWQALSNAAASQPELVAELLISAQPNNQTALQMLGRFASMNFKIIKDHPNLAEILNALTDLDIEHTHDFDYVLSLLVETSIHNELVYDSLTAWILKHYNNKIVDEKLISCFNQTIMKMANKPLLHEVITRWLISDEWVLGHAFSDLISHLWSYGVKKPVFSKDIIDTLDNEDFKYLARRLLGWTFFEEPLLALTFSLLDTKDAQRRTFSWVHELLVNDIGRNYPHATLEAIRERLSNAAPEVEGSLQTTQAGLLAYVDTIKKSPVRNELYPPIPMRVRHAIALKKTNEQREAMDKGSEQSILQQFCTRIPLKAGTGNFSIYDSKVGEVNRLASHSFFVTLPAQSVIDPLNDEIIRWQFRLAKRGDK